MILHRVVFAITLTCLALLGQTAHKSHLTVTPDQLKWGPLPAGAVRGTPPQGFGAPRAEIAVIEGDPTKPGLPFVIRIKAPDGEKVAPHWHPADEHLTILQGTFALGMGEKFSESEGTELTAGSYATVSKRMWHFGRIKGETIIQVHGIGPFVINFGPMTSAKPAPKPKSE